MVSTQTAASTDPAVQLPGAGPGDPGQEYVRALDRGLAVIRAFDEAHPRRTLAEVARAVGLAPATARRLLHTLQSLDYVGTDGHTWSLRPRLLELGAAYLSTTTVWDVVRERLGHLAAEVAETASAGVLEGSHVLYTVRVPYRRIMTMNVEVGSRIPAHASSMGRVLLADLDDAELEAWLDRTPLDPVTTGTVRSRDELRDLVVQVREQGWASVDQELEAGVQCVAAPVHGADGRVLAAVTLSSHTSRTDAGQLTGHLLPALLRAAADIDRDLARR
ncbi:transcriptional regulator, IclR family [Klenkia marina]|uniref:Transcriptional regulator, IclR family n=1 Tax=Klenkia marina TaxID=1960309 RepID=A0A1G4YM13_9ACTN|nr:IclR family transcriptional regulator C-terminal domain-containing protein [Klenkia marina]SCX54537.1 transcriptional regulator, IclR family [Klenkia marina]